MMKLLGTWNAEDGESPEMQKLIGATVTHAFILSPFAILRFDTGYGIQVFANQGDKPNELFLVVRMTMHASLDSLEALAQREEAVPLTDFIGLKYTGADSNLLTFENRAIGFQPDGVCLLQREGRPYVN